MKQTGMLAVALAALAVAGCSSVGITGPTKSWHLGGDAKNEWHDGVGLEGVSQCGLRWRCTVQVDHRRDSNGRWSDIMAGAVERHVGTFKGADVYGGIAAGVTRRTNATGRHKWHPIAAPTAHVTPAKPHRIQPVLRLTLAPADRFPLIAGFGLRWIFNTEGGK